MRNGTILIVVSGIAALLAGLTVTFLSRMRSDAEESMLVVREAQAHIMLVAGCNYIMEASRLGWGTIGAPAEGFGWIDVRDGKRGPKTEGEMGMDDDRRFPIGSVARFPMYVERRPPFAVLPKVAPNPIDVSAGAGAARGKPYVRFKDPVPVVDPQVDWSGYVTGITDPEVSALNAAWFRVYRDGPASFIVTCGAGNTLGYREEELQLSPSDMAVFGNDIGFFRSLRNNESVLWYHVEWSAAIPASEYQNMANDYLPAGGSDHYLQWPLNSTHRSAVQRSQGKAPNAVGTISFVQRLSEEPAHW